jgi:SpoIVB peptidase S55
MLHGKVRGRRRVAATLAASLGVVAAAGAVTTGPAQSVPPTGDCPTAFPVDDLVRDQQVEGLTVTQGTAPTTFTGQVIGVLENGIAPDLDMIMMELDSDEIRRVGGIWQGMSGSPVYDPTSGDLIGAVAYGLSWGPSPVAGITPYEKMDDYLAAGESPARTVEVGSADASQIADESDVTQAQAGQGFSRLAIPKTFNGVSGWRLQRAATKAPPQGKARPYVAKRFATMSGASDGAAMSSDLVAGGNLGASFAYGDIIAGGVGTVTSVCEGRLVGFGHPMMFSGSTSLSLHPASALFVQPESLGAPFKVANFAAPVGTITDDRTAGISGDLTGVPDTMDVTSTLTYNGVTRPGTTHVSVPGANAEMTFYQQLVNHDVVLDSYGPGSELQDWTITGTENGTPFTLSHRDRFASDYDIAFESPWDVADAVWALSGMPGVGVDTVQINGELVDDHSTWRVVGLEQRRAGQWVRLNRRHPAIVRAGDTLAVRALLENGTRDRAVRFDLPVPARARGAAGMVAVGGGGSSWFFAGGADSVAELENGLASMARNDAVEGQLLLEKRREVIERRAVSEPTNKVVRGHRRGLLIVR